MADRSSKWSELPEYFRDLFYPESIAVIGASTHRKKVGNAVLLNIKNAGFSGDIYPVNPKASQVEGLNSYRSVSELPRAPSLAVVVVPAISVPQVIQECGGEGIRVVIVISAGFKESGIEGRKLEKELVIKAQEGGVRILGPNCLGVINPHAKLNATFSSLNPIPGNIGLVSQSGAFCTTMLDWSRSLELGYSKLVSLGNSADLGESDVLEVLADDDETAVVAMYLEGVSDGSRFRKAVDVSSRKKPLVILKAGTTSVGARAVSSHTGSLAGSEEAYAALLGQTPAIRAETVEDFLQLIQGFSTESLPERQGVAIVTNAGGPGIIAADACERLGLRLATISPETQESLREVLPPACSVGNPVDVLGDADAGRYCAALDRVLSDEAVGAVLVILTPQAMTPIDEVAEAVADMRGCTDKEIMASFMGGETMRDAMVTLQRAGIPCYHYPDAALEVLQSFYCYIEGKKKKRVRPPRLLVDRKSVVRVIKEHGMEESAYLDPVECREVLFSYGIKTPPFVIAESGEEAVRIAGKIGYPVALKVISPQVLHKTDVGGVILDLRSAGEVERGFEDILSSVRDHMRDVEIRGIAVQKMVPQGRELIVGSVRDSQFGHMVMVGMGGIYVEILHDVSFRLAPLSRSDAAEMLRELKAYKLLEGVRGEPRADIEAVEELLLRVSQLVGDFKRIFEMDINPMMVYNAGEGYTCVDVRIALEV